MRDQVAPAVGGALGAKGHGAGASSLAEKTKTCRANIRLNLCSGRSEHAMGSRCAVATALNFKWGGPPTCLHIDGALC